MEYCDVVIFDQRLPGLSMKSRPLIDITCFHFISIFDIVVYVINSCASNAVSLVRFFAPVFNCSCCLFGAASLFFTLPCTSLFFAHLDCLRVLFGRSSLSATNRILNAR